MEHRHAEAFRIMKYRADDRHLEELVWNSRDGVTPFVIAMRDGSPGTHVNWQSDLYAPDHKPKVGDRIFVDMTEEHARELAESLAQRHWDDDGDTEMYGTIEAMAEAIYDSMQYELRQGAPALVEVTEEMARERGWL